MRGIKKIVLSVLLILVIVVGGFSIYLSDKYVVPVMMYHNVGYSEKPESNWVTPENFQKHMSFIKRNGYRVISLEELLEGIKDGSVFPRNTVVITFDDAPDNNYSYAFPVLQQFSFPVTIFAISDLVGQKGFMTWNELREMMAVHVTIGSHSRRHPYLPELTAAQQEDEIAGSKKVLEENLGVPVNLFAYPSGGFSDAIKEIVKRSGYKAACTTNRGYQPRNKDVYELKRIRFSDKDNSEFYLRTKLSGYYTLFKGSKAPN